MEFINYIISSAIDIFGTFGFFLVLAVIFMGIYAFFWLLPFHREARQKRAEEVDEIAKRIDR